MIFGAIYGRRVLVRMRHETHSGESVETCVMSVAAARG